MAGEFYAGPGNHRAGGIYQINPLTKVFQSISSGVNSNVTSIDPTKTTLYVGWKDTPLATVGTGTNFGAGTPHPLSGDDTVASGLAFLPDGSVWYTTGGEDQLGNVGTIDLTTYTTTRKLAAISATSITYDPFTGDIFTSGIDGIAQINPATGTVVSTWANPQGMGLFIASLAATGTGQLVAFDGSNLLRIWDFSSGSKLIGGAGTVIASAPTTVTSGGLYLAQVQSDLLNISTRLDVLAGNNVLIGGFIITGTEPKKVIVRAIGPSLGPLGVAGALADPTLELHEPDGTVIMNDNWRDTQENEIIATTIPPSDDLESAIVATLAPGAYTAIVSGKNLGTGIGLVEAYDLDQTAASQLGNISTRGVVETGNNVMIGGFIVGGGGGGVTTVIVRAIGPSLGPLGVAGALADPTLELHDSDGMTLAFNDNWKDTQETEINATTIPPSDDLESAIVATLAPGAYTAIVSGKNDGTGVALVEAYNLH